MMVNDATTYNRQLDFQKLVSGLRSYACVIEEGHKMVLDEAKEVKKEKDAKKVKKEKEANESEKLVHAKEAVAPTRTIPFWRPGLGKVIIYPHLEINEVWTYDRMRDEVLKMKETLTELSFITYMQSSYCSEINGRWNVAFSLEVLDGDTTFHRTYMIRYDHHLKKVYCCPFYHEDYGYLGNNPHRMLGRTECPKEFEILEKYMMEHWGGTPIDTFPA
tara:strand:+ start:1090 stop:1743 length:654 start_codon:yes stop_codon:yes gene_type:complete